MSGKRVRMAAAILAVTVFAACSKYDDSGIKKDLGDLKESITALQAAINALKTQYDAGAMIESITPITDGAGGWRITFTGGTTSTIDVMNGADGVSAPDILPVTPQIEVREGEDGVITLWYNVGGDWIDTGVNIRGQQGAPGNSGAPGDDGEAGPPGAPGVSPQVRVIANDDNTITIQYNTGTGWVDAGDPITVGNPDDKAAISSIIDNGETVTITVIKDGEPIEYEFAKASDTTATEVSRIELVGFNEKVTIAHGETEEIRIRINPSTADVSGTWSLDQTGIRSRASYVTVPTNFELVSVDEDVEENNELTGQYVATIRCTAYDPNKEYAMALVLNTGTEANPVLVSSPTFVLETAPAILMEGATGSLWFTIYEDGMMTIMGEGATDNYLYPTNDVPWKEHRATIEKVVIGDGVTTIGISAFFNHNALTEVTIPTSVTDIRNSAFNGCTSLAQITIPVDMATIGIFPFDNCPALESVTCLATNPPALNMFNFGVNTSDTLYVPAESVDAYKANERWKTAFTNIVVI